MMAGSEIQPKERNPSRSPTGSREGPEAKAAERRQDRSADSNLVQIPLPKFALRIGGAHARHVSVVKLRAASFELAIVVD